LIFIILSSISFGDSDSLRTDRNLLSVEEPGVRTQKLQVSLSDAESRYRSLLIKLEKLRDEQRTLLSRQSEALEEAEKLDELESTRFSDEEKSLKKIKTSLLNISSTKVTIPSNDNNNQLSNDDSDTDTTRRTTLKLPPRGPTNQKRVTAPKFCIISAYSGDLYDPMGVLSDLTKEKYAWLHGYDFYSDPTLFNSTMSWGQRSAIRLILYRKYLPRYEWVYWSDSDVLIVNPAKRLEMLVDNEHDAVISKDWGGAQTNPGSMLLRNSPGGWELLKTWEEFIAKPETYHDDLIAFEKMIHEREDMNKKVKWVRQKEINAYPGMGPRDKTYDDLLKPENRHDLHQPGDFVVHVVNCLRDGGTKDPICCAGLAAQYFRDFELAWRKESGVPLYVAYD